MSQKYRNFSRSSERSGTGLPSGVIRMGYLKKLKKLKRRFFVLHMESNYGMARLEYYGSEKKWRLGTEPRRIIDLRFCLNINRRPHAKYKNVIVLYTQFDCFSVVADTEEELQEWLTDLQGVQKYFTEQYAGRPIYDHLWQVVIDRYDLENDRVALGPYRVALSQKSLFLINMTPLNDNDQFEFPLMSIRRCGHSKDHFFIELGRSSVIGAGEIYMATEGTYVAQNMHETVLSAMKVREDSRPRSASTSDHSSVGRLPLPPTGSLSNSRERCDSLPTHSPFVMSGGSLRRLPSRPHSMYEWPSWNSTTSFCPSPVQNINSSSEADPSFQTASLSHPLSPPDDYKEGLLKKPFFSLDRKKLNVKKELCVETSPTTSASKHSAQKTCSLDKSSPKGKLLVGVSPEKPPLPARASNCNLEEVFYSSSEKSTFPCGTVGMSIGEYVNIDLRRRPTQDPNYSNIQFGKPPFEFRKQLSAPLSPRPDAPASPGRKTSCPIPHLTPDHSSISSVSSASDEVSSAHGSPKASATEAVQMYENVSLPQRVTLNYACLDLTPAATTAPPSQVPPASNYAQIDFTKSEGLKSIVRDLRS